MKIFFLLAGLLILMGGAISAGNFSTYQAAQKLSFQIEGQERTAIVYPNSAGPKSDAPLVMVFHGHGGTAQFMARRANFQQLWPEAVIVYLQGLPGVAAGIIDPQGKAPGWQINPGDQNDRDVKFFDAVLDQIQPQYKTDPKRVYLMGHSNGARFVNVLWKMRGDKITALASASAQGGLMIREAQPRSVFMLIGEQDPLVPARGQLIAVDIARQLLHTDSSKAKADGYAKSEFGNNGLELMTYIHPGGHPIPDEALPLMVKFFQRHPRP